MFSTPTWQKICLSLSALFFASATEISYAEPDNDHERRCNNEIVDDQLIRDARSYLLQINFSDQNGFRFSREGRFLANRNITGIIEETASIHTDGSPIELIIQAYIRVERDVNEYTITPTEDTGEKLTLYIPVNDNGQANPKVILNAFFYGFNRLLEPTYQFVNENCLVPAPFDNPNSHMSNGPAQALRVLGRQRPRWPRLSIE